MKNLALREAIGERQKEFIEKAFGEGAPASMLSKESLENLIWRVNNAFKDAWDAHYDAEMGQDEPLIDTTCPWLRQGPDGLYRVYNDKVEEEWFYRFGC